MPRNRILSVFVQRSLNGEALILAGKGTRCQNYVDVRDVAVAVEGCLGSKTDGVYNIGGLRAISNLELAELCISVCGSRSQVTFSGTADAEEGIVWDVSIARARAGLGYEPHIALQDSISAVAAEISTGNRAC
jgi:nucleoside-diphosphate-sugar epimerase